MSVKGVPVVDSVSIKLPGFWTSEPILWFVQAESQFALRNITVEDTKYHHVVAALDQSTAKRVADIFLSPSTDGSKYTILKDRLLAIFSLSSYQRAQLLQQVSPLGDRRPSELMSEMLALLGKHEPCFLFKSLFMDHLPREVRSHLIHELDDIDPRKLALLADKLVSVQNPMIAGLSGAPKKSSPPSPSSRRKSWCRFHQRYGPKAFNCEQPCSFVQRNKPSWKSQVLPILGNEEDDHQ
ncbi:uncharacterized protein LOC131886789 [Tigriopus californicus]|uniref:uncharacterized protein LOC131886789 n=1 Tax=Tigriopus californicus TaxID=6832 RepID=UPI0027DA0A79|nr:uncharacterized protein LOC131886789 [Tigriopus californicus]